MYGVKFKLSIYEQSLLIVIFLCDFSTPIPMDLSQEAEEPVPSVNSSSGTITQIRGPFCMSTRATMSETFLSCKKMID